MSYCKKRAPITIYLDDRTIWTKGAQSVDTVLNAGAEADTVLGLELHPDKLSSFATHKHLQQQLMLKQDIVGKPAKQLTCAFRHSYNLDNLNACVDHLAITGVVQERRSVAVKFASLPDRLK